MVYVVLGHLDYEGAHFVGDILGVFATMENALACQAKERRIGGWNYVTIEKHVPQ